MKVLSVVVPSYNSEAYLHKCVDSLLKGGERMEVIIVNDGSKDNTGKIADEYAAKYPDIVKVVHQENKGHGGGINSGIATATGKYFKVVDSDDSLDEKSLLTALDALENSEVDMFVSNYKYTHEDPKDDRVIKYSAIPKNRVITWDEIGTFRMEQYLTIHSVAYRTETVRESGVVLPEHVFYEDNTFVCTVLPYVKKILYLDINLYNYTIGRDGQSVQESVIMRRYKHQMLTARTVFTAYKLEEVESKQLRKLLFHEISMMVLIGVIFARLNKTEEAEKDVEDLYAFCAEYDAKLAKRVRRRSMAAFVSIPGKFGRAIAIACYRFARAVVKFNE